VAEVQTAAPVQAETKKDPLAALVPGRVVYYWEPVLNRGLVPCPAFVVEAFKDSNGVRTGHARLFVLYLDGADGPRPNVAPSDEPKADHWTWPMNPDGRPFA